MIESSKKFSNSPIKMSSFSKIAEQTQEQFMNKPSTTALRKSIFFPSHNERQSYLQRASIKELYLPEITIVKDLPMWLLIQTNRYSTRFFAKVNAGLYLNVYDEIYLIFQSFNTLVKKHGYFRITKQMILLGADGIKVWINQDIFSNQVMLPIPHDPSAEAKYILHFVNLITRQFPDWKSTQVQTINSLNQHLRRCAVAIRENQLTRKQNIRRHLKTRSNIHEIIHEQIMSTPKFQSFKSVCNPDDSIPESETAKRPNTFNFEKSKHPQLHEKFISEFSHEPFAETQSTVMNCFIKSNILSRFYQHQNNESERQTATNLQKIEANPKCRNKRRTNTEF